ncbi:CopM family metallochaperone [Microvirga sp. G4-2]|uniref:CopM family metallochaperone n=1 Tax=Microvirga sp. G4-2 TaxID=3434467 RepID=UPI0040447BB5
MILRSLIMAASIMALPTLVFAQGVSHSGHSTPMQTQHSTDTPATKGYREANAKMHRNMDIPYTGDSDADFVRSMIPHHQGAIDMAKVALQNAKDEQVRKWATDVIREQEREIAEMQAWLKKKGVQ